jgi:hypothetical protein
VFWFEIRAVRQQDTIAALEKWALEMNDFAESVKRIADMHNDTLGTLVVEVNDLQKFIAAFRLLRDQAEVIQ